jgi:hypothetical protein
MARSPRSEISPRVTWFWERVFHSPGSLLLIALTAAGTLLVIVYPPALRAFAVPSGDRLSWSLPFKFVTHATVCPSGRVWLASGIYILLCGVVLEPELGSRRVIGIALMASVACGMAFHFLGGGRSYAGSYPIAVGLMGAVLGAAPQFWHQWGRLHRLFAAYLLLITLAGLGAALLGFDSALGSGAWAGLTIGLVAGYWAAHNSESVRERNGLTSA